MASGGIGSVDDIIACAAAGASGVVLGKALYEGHVDLAAAIPRGAGLEGSGLVNSLPSACIPCLDVIAGRVMKGVAFVDLRDAGDPAELATTL